MEPSISLYKQVQQTYPAAVNALMYSSPMPFAPVSPVRSFYNTLFNLNVGPMMKLASSDNDRFSSQPAQVWFCTDVERSSVAILFHRSVRLL